MSQILSTYIKNFQFFPKSAIYDEDAKYRISEFNRHVATLYFIVRTKRATFIPSTFIATQNFSFCGIVEVDGKQINVEVNTADFLHSFPGMKDRFATSNHLAEYIMRRWDHPAQVNLTSGEKFVKNAFVDHAKSGASRLVVECPLRNGIARERIGTTTIAPYQALNVSGVIYPSPLEILYIGKSNDDTWDRIYNHNKWGLIDEHRVEDQELLVYFLEIDKNTVIEEALQGASLIVRDKSDLSIEDATLATEAALINYFIREKKFNHHHVGSDIAKSDMIVDRIKARGYTDLIVECDLLGGFGALGTKSVGYKNRHFVEFKL